MSEDFNVRHASLLTLGFICEDINTGSIDETNMNSILYALLENIFPDSLELTRVSMKAFARAAPITEKNFPV